MNKKMINISEFFENNFKYVSSVIIRGTKIKNFYINKNKLLHIFTEEKNNKLWVNIVYDNNHNICFYAETSEEKEKLNNCFYKLMSKLNMKI